MPAFGQKLEELPTPKEINLPDGHEVVDNEGKVLKQVSGASTANVQAYFDQDGFRYYMSDWSFRRLKDKGITPNWIRVRRPTGEGLPRRDSSLTVKKSPQSEFDQIDVLILNGDLQAARAKLARARGQGNAKNEAEFSLRDGALSFVGGKNDMDAIGQLVDSARRFEALDKKGTIGRFKAMDLLVKISFERTRQFPSELMQDLRPLEEAAYRASIGCSADATEEEVYQQVVSTPALSALEKEIALLTRRILAKAKNSGEIRKEIVDREQNRRRSIFFARIWQESQSIPKGILRRSPRTDRTSARKASRICRRVHST